MAVKDDNSIVGNQVKIELLTVLYMLPLVNFLFLSQAPYTVPLH